MGRFLSPDNYIQEPFNTQNFNRYGYVLNNPLKYTDQSGEEFFLAALVGALISVATNGIVNLIEGRPFFEGVGLAAFTGAIGGVFAKVIGNAVSTLSGILKVTAQAVAHAHLGGMMTVAMGGDYFSGFAAGAIGSTIASGAGGLLKSASNFWKGAGTIAAGSLSGGVGSVIAGGKFWDGFRNGAISSSLNHVVHQIQERLDSYFDNKKAAYDFAQEESLIADLGDGLLIEREVSGYALKNGDYIVLDSTGNTRTKSQNPMIIKNGKNYVRFQGKLYEIKSQFHTHPSGMKHAPGRVGVSKADLSLMYNRLGGSPMSVLYRGNEWVISPGNQYQKYGYNYSLKNIGSW